MVIGMYALGSIWFILNPKDGLTPTVIPKSHEPRAMSILKANIHEFLDQEMKREAEEIKMKQEQNYKNQVQKDELQANQGAIDDFVNRAQEMKNQKKWNEAMQILDEGLAKFPKSDKILGHKGGWYFDKEDWNNAALYFEKAHDQNPDDFYWVQNVAMCLNKLEQGAKAAQWLWKAYDVKKSMSLLLSICDTQWKFNDFTRYQELIENIMSESEQMFSRGEAPNVNPFSALHLPYDLEQLFLIAQSQTKNLNDIDRRKTETLPLPTWDGKRKIRVGYISPDIRHHAVGIQIRSMFEYHNRSEFEIYVFSCYEGSSHNDEIYMKIKHDIDHMVDVWDRDVYQAAKKINEYQVDILIDIGLFTAYARMDVFALRPAPISAGWLGLATTTGSPYYDYIIGDHFVIKPEHEKGYSEKVLSLPHSYHIFDHKQYYPYTEHADHIKSEYFHTPIPRDTSNPPFFFCNHANNYRLDPYIFSDWMQILDTTPNSSLILKYYNEESRLNLEKEAKRYKNIRLYDGKMGETREWYSILFQRGGGMDHIAKKSICDLYLDIPKYNGHSTSGDMLWGGIPLVTRPLSTMASRAAGSFAITSGIPDMIASTSEEYIKIANYYGSHPDKLKPIRKRLEEGRMTNPLFDTYLFVKHLEQGYKHMMNIKYIENKPPRRINVENLIDKYGYAVRMKEIEKNKKIEEDNRKLEEEKMNNQLLQLEKEKKEKEAAEAEEKAKAQREKAKAAGPLSLDEAIEEKKQEIKELKDEHAAEKAAETVVQVKATQNPPKAVIDGEDVLGVKDKPLGLEVKKQ